MARTSSPQEILPSLEKFPSCHIEARVNSLSRPLHVSSSVEGLGVRAGGARGGICLSAMHMRQTSPSQLMPGLGGSEVGSKVKIGAYFATWWALNVVFNIYNKKVLNAFPYRWLTSTLSLAAGSLIMLVSWDQDRRGPETDLEFWKTFAPCCSSTYDWACCSNREYVKGCGIIYSHHQECRTSLQCVGFEVPPG
ncbi:hypothetical protein MLD38_035264 [Melastoma candidum]|uniref:Uncharacterized protein n=1 Tax=Melastoma candidum TaxID=119954 RepID=A0ACB9MCK3_9MYRT|nr:hypothetical protein MLD38_035264 [Melastoma candidum]